MKKVFSLIFTLLLLATLTSTPAKASYEIQPFASYYLSSYSINVYPQGNGVLLIDATVCAVHPNMTKLGFPVIALYELNNNSWTVVHAVSSQYSSKEKAGLHGYQFTYQGTVGKSYYAGASFVAEDSTGGDHRSANSLTKKAT